MSPATPILQTATLHVPFRVVKRPAEGDADARPHPAREHAGQHAGQGSGTRIPLERDARIWGVCDHPELAEREGIAPSCKTRVLSRTLPAPDIVEAIMDGKQGPEMTLAQVLEPFSNDWRGHRTSLTSRP